MADNRTYYDAFSTHYEDARHHGYHRFLDEAEMSVIAPHIAGRDVLEVGCGTGLILARIRDRARRAAGIDLSPGMLEHARKRGLEVYEADATKLPFDDASFDVTVSFKVLAHVERIGEALAEMARVTRPGGRVIAEFYNAKSVRTLVKKLKPSNPIGPRGEHTDDDVYTRYDTFAGLLSILPAELSLAGVDGIRVLSPAAAPFNVPVLGRAWAVAERAAMRTPLKRFGGFLVLHLNRA